MLRVRKVGIKYFDRLAEAIGQFKINQIYLKLYYLKY